LCLSPDYIAELDSANPNLINESRIIRIARDLARTVRDVLDMLEEYKRNAKVWSKINVGDIPNRYTSDVVLNQQARVAHLGGMADCLPGGPVAGETMAVLDAAAHGGSVERPMAGCLVVHV
jgi:hypothetical protein